MTFQDRAVIVTGGASGIGGGITRLLVRRGARVVVVDVSLEAGEAIQRDLGDAVVFLQGDVSRRETADQAVALAVKRFGRLDGLVNNAHASRQMPFMQQTQEAWELSFGTGFWATVHFMQAAYPALRQSRGAVVNFGSGAGLEGQPTQASYAAAKEAIRGLSRVVANEWAGDGIRVNVVCPIALTEGVRRWAEQAPELYQEVRDKIPLGRFGDPERDVAPVVLFLLSDDAAYMTGQTVMADGG